MHCIVLIFVEWISILLVNEGRHVFVALPVFSRCDNLIISREIYQSNKNKYNVPVLCDLPKSHKTGGH